MVKAKLYRQNHRMKHTHTHSEKEKKEKIYISICTKNTYNQALGEKKVANT